MLIAEKYMRLSDIPKILRNGYEAGKSWPFHLSFILILSLEAVATILFIEEIFAHTITIDEFILQLIGTAVVAHWVYMSWSYIKPTVKNLQRIREWRRRRRE